ncbi:MAG: DNA mismatch repair protein MutS [Candidatus Acetothermia bacterium]|jgi:DNA mismatch repair protein MutS|nr:DNA mismatch repair protein MutS [Candidatus Acetothermia bacterium]
MELTPMMRQYHAMKARYPGAILFFQLGDFYETFFEDAEVVARELEITLTARDGAPMAGVPVRKAALYVARLLRRGYKVALCPQLERPGKGKALLRREVVRVLTPGTAIEEGVLDADQDTLLAAVWPEGDRVGAAWAEAASGEFWAEELGFADLPQLAARLPVREWIFPEGWSPPADLPGARTPRPAGDFSLDLLQQRFPRALAEAPLAARAAGALVAYLAYTVGELAHLRAPALRPADEAMALDAFTQRSLELIAPLRPEGRLTLLSVLDRTKTPMGRRLLRRWILAPLRDLPAIAARLDAVDALVRSGAWEELGRALARAGDLPRLLGRVSVGAPTPVDLAVLGRTLDAAQGLASTLRGVADPLPGRLAAIAGALDAAPAALADEIRRALVDAPPPSLDQGWVIREGYNARLDGLRAEARRLREEITALEGKERRRTGIGSLKVGYNRMFGYYFEVTRAHLGKVPADWRRRQSCANGERFTSGELAALADRLTAVEEEARAAEEDLFRVLGDRVRAEIPALARVGEALAELDVLRSLAEVAHRRGYSRPRFTDRAAMRIREGRHPMVEEVVQFVSNDLDMGEGVRLAVVTGPNMAGKSVFLRQVALIALLAQMGSFVPAREAELPVFDRIYTRVGASDALTEGLSTFMAEMREAAEILSGATERSLVILDELGRGTSTHDGMALAWAIARYLAERVRCKTLFATHYRELSRLAEEVPGAMNLHAAVREWRGEVVFLYRVLPGVAERSYGVHVAKLAGLPEVILGEAGRVLAELERAAPTPRGGQGEQLPLFGGDDHPVLADLRRLDPERLTPLEALALLAELRRRLG